MPAATESAIRKKQDSVPNAIFEGGPTPNHMITIGKKMIFGVGPRRPCISAEFTAPACRLV